MKEEGEPGSMARAVWIHLASQGGRWSLREIKQALPDVFCANWSSMLKDMTLGGNVVRYEGARGNEYGVTAACRPTRKVTLADIIASGVVNPSPGVA